MIIDQPTPCWRLLRLQVLHKKLEVRRCKKLVKVEIDDHYLTSFDYAGENVISFSSNALVLTRAFISLNPRNVDAVWYVKLIEFLGKLSKTKVLILHSKSHKNVIVPKEIRESLLPPMFKVEQLILTLDREVQSQSVEEIVDGLF